MTWQTTVALYLLLGLMYVAYNWTRIKKDSTGTESLSAVLIVAVVVLALWPLGAIGAAAGMIRRQIWP